MAKITFADKQVAANPGNPQENEKFRAEDANELKNGINAAYDLIDGKASKINGQVPESELPAVNFQGLSGNGTIQDPYVFAGDGGNQASAEDYLKSLPGYLEGVEQILYGGGSSGFTWGPIPSGSLTKLETPELTLGTPSVNSIPLSWTGVVDAVTYLVQRADNALFSGAVNIYNGPLLSFSESNLVANTAYHYRVRAVASGYANSDWDSANATTAATGNITPPAPTNGSVNDTLNTFDWTNATGYANLSNYEYTLNGGTSYQDASAKPIQVGNVAKAIGQVGVRIKAATGRTVSDTLFNTSPFGIALTTPATPTAGVVDNTNDTFDWTYSLGFTSPDDYEYTLNGGTSYSPLPEKPLFVGDIGKPIGQVGVRVKAVAGVNNASNTLFNAAAFTIAPPTMTPVPLNDVLTNVINLLITDVNDVTAVDNSTYAWAASTLRLPVGGAAILQMSFAGSNNLHGIAVALSRQTISEGENNFDFRINRTNSNELIGGAKGQYPKSPSLASSPNSLGRMRATGTQIFTEYSTDGGNTWTQIGAAATQIQEVMYFKIFGDPISLGAGPYPKATDISHMGLVTA